MTHKINCCQETKVKKSDTSSNLREITDEAILRRFSDPELYGLHKSLSQYAPLKQNLKFFIIRFLIFSGS